MKKIIAVTALMFSTCAFAQSTSSTVSSGTGTANNAGNAQSIIFNTPDQTAATKVQADAAVEVASINAATAKEIASRAQVVKNTPSVSGPNLTTSNDTCMGSTSGSVNIAGLGVGAGTSWVDNNCKMLKNSRELWNMGMRAASLALMCTDAANREALEITGYECPQTAKARNPNHPKEAVPQARTSGADLTDPYIRSRLGMPALEVASN